MVVDGYDSCNHTIIKRILSKKYNKLFMKNMTGMQNKVMEYQNVEYKTKFQFKIQPI